MALNRKGERRQKNRLMNELYRGEAITRGSNRASQHRAEKEWYKSKMLSEHPESLALAALTSWSLRLASPGSFSSKTQRWREKRHHPGLSALEIVSIHAEERRMVDWGASVLGEGIQTYKANKTLNQFALWSCARNTAKLKINKTLLHITQRTVVTLWLLNKKSIGYKPVD